MQLSLLSSLGLLSLLGHNVQASPIATTSTNICTLPWVKLGELALILLPSSQGPKLCSSVLHKYATITQTITITAPAVTQVPTISLTSTAPTLTTSVTTTVSIESDVSTSTTTLTTATTISLTTVSATTTITGSVNEKRAVTTTDNTSRLANLLNIASTLISEFCSCEAPGSTSTSTMLVSLTITPTTTVPTTIIASTLTPRPSTVSATVLTTFTSVISTVVIKSALTSTIPSTTTTVEATITNPGCPTAINIPIPYQPQDIYTQFAFTYGFRENPNNSGNEYASDGLGPLTTTYPAGDFCYTLQECLTFTANQPYGPPYNSAEFHYLISENVYECTAYFNPNTDASSFNVPDANVGQAYGYSYPELTITIGS